MSRRRLVVVTRPAEEAERTRSALIDRGYDVLIEPLLTIAPLAESAARLGDLAQVAALLFTSINGVRAFAAGSERRDLPVYAVGPTTAEAARAAGFSTVHTAEGDVAALARLVSASHRPDQGRLLHPAGESVAGDLAGALGGLGYDVERLALYRAEPATSLSDEFRDTLARNGADAIAFFSPRTARTFVSLARTAGLETPCRHLVAACLSPAVAEAARALEWRGVAVADEPTQGSLIAALDRALAVSGTPGTEQRDMADEKKDEAHPSEPSVGTPATDQSPPPAADAAPAPTIALPAADVIQRFGGIRPMASKMNISFSTVQGWKERNHLPPTRHAEIVALAARHGVSLEPGTAAAAEPAPASPPEAAAQVTPPSADAPKAEPPGFEDTPPPLPPPLPPQTVPSPPSGISLFGAVVVSVIVVAVAMFGAYATRSSWSGGGGSVATDNTGELSQRIAKLERDAAAPRPAPTPTPAAPDPKLAQDIAALSKETAELEAALASARSGSAAAAEQAKALAPRLEALEKGFDLQAFLAVRNGLSELGGKLDGLAKRMEAAERATTAARMQGLAEAALALSVAQLRHAIDAGAPFAAELAACRAAAGSDAKAAASLDALAPLAGNGVATRAVLSDDYAETARAIAQASLKRKQTGWLRTVIDRIDSLVTIRPVGADVAGDDPRARAARAEVLLDRGDLAGAVRLLGELRDRPAEAAKPWLDKAKARLAAEASVAALESQAMAGLAQRAAQVQKPTGAPQ